MEKDKTPTNSSNQHRITVLDILRGILIISMVIGHTHNFMTAPIYLFHVAGFMTLSGYTTSNREKYTIFIGRKVLSLVVPFLLINVIFIGIAHFINKQVKQDAFISIPSIQDFLINLNTVDIAGATWFLVVLFYATIIVGGIVRFAKSNFALNIILIVSLVLAIVVQEFDIRYTRHLDLTALATFFLLLGNFVKRYKLLPKHFSLGIGHLVSVFVIIFSVKIYYLGMDWPSRTFNLPANLLTVCSGMYLAYAIALIATKNKTTSNILQTIGRRTIPILFFHLFGFKVLYYILWQFQAIDEASVSNIVLEYRKDLWFLIVVFGMMFSLFWERITSCFPLIYKYLFGREVTPSNWKNNCFRIATTYPWTIVVLCAVSFNLWVLSSSNFFVLDDFGWLNIIKNHSFFDLFDFLPQSKYNDRPIGAIFMKCLFSLFSLNYVLHHSVLLGLHIINAYGVYRLTLQFNKDRIVAVLAGVVFSAWPMSTMAISWNASIFDLLGASFTIAILNLYFIKRKSWIPSKAFALSLLMIVLYYLGIRTKEMTVVIPFMLMIYEVFDSIKNKKVNISALTVIMNVIMILYIGILLNLDSVDNITEQLDNPYYQSFHFFDILITTAKYLTLLFDLQNPKFVFDGFSILPFILLSTAFIAFLTSAYHSKKNSLTSHHCVAIWLIVSLGPVLPMVNMQHRLYLYIPSIYFSICLAISISIIFRTKFLRKSSILASIITLTWINQLDGGKGFRNYWSYISRNNLTTYNNLIDMNLQEFDSICVNNVNNPINIFQQGPGDVLRVLGNRLVKVNINGECENSGRNLDLDYDNATGHTTTSLAYLENQTPSSNTIDQRLKAVLIDSDESFSINLEWISSISENAHVFVSQDHEEEKLLGSGRLGSVNIDWIQENSLYRFTLYRGINKKNPITSIELRRIGDSLEQKVISLKTEG